MKYESLQVEVITVQNEDILTLSNQGSGSGKQMSWGSLGFTNPGVND